MELVVDIEGETGSRSLPGSGADLIAFMSFCGMRGFGAQHPLIAIADRLHAEFRLRLGPLTTFYGADPEDAEDAEKLEKAWQDAAGLAETLDGVLDALASDRILQALLRRAGAEPLVEQAAALLGIAERAAARQLRVRLSFRD